MNQQQQSLKTNQIPHPSLKTEKETMQTDLPELVSSVNSRRDNHLAAIALNEVGRELYGNGQLGEAIAMFDAAATVVKSPTAPCPLLSQHLHWGCQRINAQAQPNVGFQQHPPDLYLEGECDVGPRPLREPLHLEASSSSPADEFILEAMVVFNKALVHHSKSELDEAMEHYSTALQILAKNSNVGHEKDTKNHMTHLGMMIHNNMGQICYIEDEDNSVLHFSAAAFCAKQMYTTAQKKDDTLIFSTVLSNYCRSQWINCNVDTDTYQDMQTVLLLRLSVLPAEHVDVACAYYNLGAMAFVRDEFDRAKTLFQQYLNLSKAKDSPLDPIPAITFILLIENEDKEDQFSLELLRVLNALQEKREEYGPAHIEVASLLNYIGTLLFHRKELHAAIVFYREELRIEMALLNTEAGMSVSVTYNNIGRILQELGELPEAIGCYRNALKTDFDDKTFVKAAAFAAGTADFSVPGHVPASPATDNLFSTIWYNLGLIHDKMGARREAVMSFQMALGLRRKTLGVDHVDIACLWYNIGTLQMEMNQLKDAAASFKEALRIRRLVQNKEEPRHLLTTLRKLAYLQQNQGNIDDALDIFHEILHIQESHAVDAPWNTPGAIGLTLRKIVNLHGAKGDLSAALASAERSCFAFKASHALAQHGAADHLKAVEEVARSLLVLGSLYNEACEPLRAQEAHKEARLVISVALCHLAGTLHPILHPLLDACTLQTRSACAPVA
jgi:tetratricopeptide (TPR) repeat protein